MMSLQDLKKYGLFSHVIEININKKLKFKHFLPLNHIIDGYLYMHKKNEYFKIYGNIGPNDSLKKIHLMNRKR